MRRMQPNSGTTLARDVGVAGAEAGAVVDGEEGGEELLRIGAAGLRIMSSAASLTARQEGQRVRAPPRPRGAAVAG